MYKKIGFLALDLHVTMCYISVKFVTVDIVVTIKINEKQRLGMDFGLFDIHGTAKEQKACG